jgi:hypothetical protein
MNVKKTHVIELRVDFPEGMNTARMKNQILSNIGIANRVSMAESENFIVARFKYTKSARKAEDKIHSVLNENRCEARITKQIIN